MYWKKVKQTFKKFLKLKILSNCTLKSQSYSPEFFCQCSLIPILVGEKGGEAWGERGEGERGEDGRRESFPLGNTL